MDWQLALERVSGDSDLVDGQNSTDGLAQHARNVANQIQTLVAHQIPEEDSLITLGDNTSYTELIRRLSIAFERQQAVNEVSFFSKYNQK
jgi:ubiquinone biosynthesis protein UbiJ